jgi:adenylylsulfate kinase-like enzyme
MTLEKRSLKKYLFVKTVYIKCSLEELRKRDTKGLLQKLIYRMKVLIKSETFPGLMIHLKFVKTLT